MGRTNVAEGKTRRCIANEWSSRYALAMKTVVLARKHRVGDEISETCENTMIAPSTTRGEAVFRLLFTLVRMRG